MSRFYILCGASGSGKTTLMNGIAATTSVSVDPSLSSQFEDQEVDETLRLIRAPKYSEREVRRKDGETDDIIHVDNISKESHDICYVLNNIKYGLRLVDIEELLARNLNPIVVVTDLRAIRDLKRHFGDRARAVFLSSAIDADKLRRIQLERLGFSPSDREKLILSKHFLSINAAARLGWWDRVSDCMNTLEQEWHAYASCSRSTEIRIARIRATHIRYIEHVDLFDHVVLNYTEDHPEEMYEQFRNIIIAQDVAKQKETTTPIFVVAAASGSGKGTLMEMLNLIGGDRVRIVSKLSLRGPKHADKRDGMIALLRDDRDAEPDWPDWWSPSMVKSACKGQFPKEYDLRWVFHTGMRAGVKSGTAYAVSRWEIERNIKEGVPQIFVSNMGQFKAFRELWPDHVVFLYLFRLVSEQENREYQERKWKDDPSQAESRVRERSSVHKEFIKHAGEFDHVLLNTSYEEDLYDQMFNLIDNYTGH